MEIDPITAFSALEQHDIRVAHSAYVDSAESAIAFAERRNAPDPRFMPIILRSTTAASTALRQLPLKDADAIRSAFARLQATRSNANERILAQTYIADGTDLMIGGTTDAALQKRMSIGTFESSAARIAPLTPQTAGDLAQEYLAYGHHGPEKAVRMIEHLLLRISSFFDEGSVRDFRLVIRLHDNGYSVIDAVMHAPGPLHVKGRLAHRAHDRKSDEYHTSGRQ